MQLSQTELRVLEQVSYGNERIEDIAQNLQKSKSQIYRARQRLSENGFLHLNCGKLVPKRTTYSSLILPLLSKYPTLVEPLSESGLNIFTSLLSPKSIKEIMRETNLKRSIIYKKIRQGRNISAITINKNRKFTINKRIWPNLRNYLVVINKFEETIDKRIPVNSVIYHKDEDEILFSYNFDFNAELTAFSKYRKYGINILIPTNFYYLPNRKLSKKEILLHSVYIVNKEKDYRYLTYLILFYLKFREDFLKIKNPILRKFESILNGKTIDGYPTLDEIKEKCLLYDIRI